jgi:hypothetical protein
MAMSASLRMPSGRIAVSRSATSPRVSRSRIARVTVAGPDKRSHHVHMPCRAATASMTHSSTE